MPEARSVPTLSAQSLSQSSASVTIFASSPVAIWLWCERKVEVEVEVAPERRHPGERPAQPLLVGLQLLDGRTGDADQRHVAVVQVDDSGVEVIGQTRATRASRLVRRAEHQVVDEELRASIEQLGERLLPFLGVEGVLLLHRDPGQLHSLLRQLLVDAGQFLLPLE